MKIQTDNKHMTLISKCVCIVCLITCDCHGAAVQIWAHYDLKQCNIGYLKKFLFLVTVAILDLGLDTLNFKINQTITINFGLRGSEKIFYVKC